MDIIIDWIDPRLRYKQTEKKDMIVLQNEGSDLIWRPDIVIPGEKGVKHDTFPKRQSSAWIIPSGAVYYFTRYLLFTILFSF